MFITISFLYGKQPVLINFIETVKNYGHNTVIRVRGCGRNEQNIFLNGYAGHLGFKNDPKNIPWQDDHRGLLS